MKADYEVFILMFDVFIKHQRYQVKNFIVQNQLKMSSYLTLKYKIFTFK